MHAQRSSVDINLIPQLNNLNFNFNGILDGRLKNLNESLEKDLARLPPLDDKQENPSNWVARRLFGARPDKSMRELALNSLAAYRKADEGLKDAQKSALLGSNKSEPKFLPSRTAVLDRMDELSQLANDIHRHMMPGGRLPEGRMPRNPPDPATGISDENAVRPYQYARVVSRVAHMLPEGKQTNFSEAVLNIRDDEERILALSPLSRNFAKILSADTRSEILSTALRTLGKDADDIESLANASHAAVFLARAESGMNSSERAIIRQKIGNWAEGKAMIEQASVEKSWDAELSQPIGPIRRLGASLSACGLYPPAGGYVPSDELNLVASAASREYGELRDMLREPLSQVQASVEKRKREDTDRPPERAPKWRRADPSDRAPSTYDDRSRGRGSSRDGAR